MRNDTKLVGKRVGLTVMFIWGCGLWGCGHEESQGPGASSTENTDNSSDTQSGEDDDGDGIYNRFEGADTELDTDNDGTPDYLDLDSDNDGIPDADEYGFKDPGYAPLNSDGDQIPDFQDTDSDNNGLSDDVDGVADLDGDGIGNYADPDDDGDDMKDNVEMDSNPASPPDTDGDQVPDYQDVDSDGDTIADKDEGDNIDTDRDKIPDYRDLDTDDDGLSDALEAGDADPDTPPIDSDLDKIPNFRDADSDNDGIRDQDEDTNVNGVLDPGETDPTKADTDGDGVSDLVEEVAGTDPQDDTKNPRANGDFVFEEPYLAPPTPEKDRLDFSTNLELVDLYILADVSGSMTGQIVSIGLALKESIDAITCSPGQTPAVDFCINDVETGVGQFGRGPKIWSHLKDIDSDHAETQAHIPTIAGGDWERPVQAMWGAINGTCASDPARIGTACFRPDSLGIIVLVTDYNFDRDEFYQGTREQALATYDLMASLGIRVMGVTGRVNRYVDTLRGQLLAMAGGNPSKKLVPAISRIPSTSQCDALNDTPFHLNRAIVYGPDSDAANALTCGIQALTAYLLQDVYAVLKSDPKNVDHKGNPVDAVSAFVDHIEVFEDGSEECSKGNFVSDSDNDGHADVYVGIVPGTPVCWKLYVKQNDTVKPTTESPQMFMATVDVHGEGDALLDSRDVYFLVPPEIENPGPK